MNPAPSLTRLADRIKLDLPIPISEIVSAKYLSRSTLLRMRISGLPSTRIGHRVFILRNGGNPSNRATLTSLRLKNAAMTSLIKHPSSRVKWMLLRNPNRPPPQPSLHENHHETQQ
jgi:hypothetical protein